MNKKPYKPEMVEMYPQYKMIPWIIGIGLLLGVICIVFAGNSMEELIAVLWEILAYTFLLTTVLFLVIYFIKILMRGKDK